jgi:hypothetical protein
MLFEAGKIGKAGVVKEIFLMKKVILGSIMFLAGLLSAAVLLAGTMSNDWVNNGQISSFWNMSQYGLMPAFYIFIGVAILGIGIAIWGVFEKKE